MHRSSWDHSKVSGRVWLGTRILRVGQRREGIWSFAPPLSAERALALPVVSSPSTQSEPVTMKGCALLDILAKHYPGSDSLDMLTTRLLLSAFARRVAHKAST